MLIRYRLYRSKFPDQIFNAEMIQVDIKNDDHLVAIDDIITGVLSNHIKNLPDVKKYGIAYVDRMEIENIEITDDDVLDLSESAFRQYMSTITPNITIIWNKTTNNIDNAEKLDKM